MLQTSWNWKLHTTTLLLCVCTYTHTRAHLPSRWCYNKHKQSPTRSHTRNEESRKEVSCLLAPTPAHRGNVAKLHRRFNSTYAAALRTRDTTSVPRTCNSLIGRWSTVKVRATSLRSPLRWKQSAATYAGYTLGNEIKGTMGWACSSNRKIGKSYKILMRRPLGKRPFERLR
jgi:hypothetical protein